jgi:hypothetical protein
MIHLLNVGPWDPTPYLGRVLIICRRQAMMTKRNADLYREAVLVFPSYAWPAMVKVSHGKWLRFLMVSHA